MCVRVRQSERVLYSPCASNDGRLFRANSALGRLVTARAVLVLDNAHLGVGIAEGGEYGQDGWVLEDVGIWLGSRCCDGRWVGERGDDGGIG